VTPDNTSGIAKTKALALRVLRISLSSSGSAQVTAPVTRSAVQFVGELRLELLDAVAVRAVSHGIVASTPLLGLRVNNRAIRQLGLTRTRMRPRVSVEFEVRSTLDGAV
jgi:hypothetical protein